MGRRIGTVAGVFAVLSTVASPVFAFQETPVPPPAQQTPTENVKPQVPAMKLGDPSGPAQQPVAKKRVPMFGFGLLPKMDFGLELLYGAAQQPLDLQQAPSLEADRDVSVVGKVKRRF